jgi:hypothetical protein
MNFAIIENNLVTNIIVAESKTVAEQITGKTCIEYTDANLPHIGLGYDGTTFEQPVVEQPTE